MFRNFLKVAWRNLVKNKAFSLINIIGLATGLACFILITLYVVDELSFDRHNKHADRIFRVDSDIKIGGTVLDLAVASDPMGATLKKDYPQVEAYVRFYRNGSKLVKKGNEYISENAVIHADSTLFDVFTLPVISGDAKTALNEPNTVVITESTANKYFGNSNVIGKMLETNDNDKTLYKVTAVIRDLPKNSHLNFHLIFSMDNVEYGFGNYLSNNFPTYVLLKDGVDYRDFNKNFKQVIEKYVFPQAKEFMHLNSMDEFSKSGNKLEIYLTPLTDIHLHSDKMAELGTNSNIQYVYIFSAVALFILLIACINFMNLSTARSASRSREVGIRKVLGTEKNALVRQFLFESTFTVLIALFIGLVIAFVVLPYFNSISGKSLSVSSLLQPKFLLFLALLPFVVGGLAGSYPALYLSSFRPIAVLKGKVNAGFQKSHFRSTLVVFQFATSIILIIGTIIIYKQLNYIQTTRLGFKREQVLIVNGTGIMGNNAADVFKTEVSKLSGVKSSSFAGFLPVGNSSRSDNTFSKEAVMDTKNALNMQNWSIDYDYINTLGMEMIKGRNFSREYGSDSNAIIINETTAKLLGYADPIGKKIYNSNGIPNEPPDEFTIIGVVRNFHFESLRENVGPLAFHLGNNKWEAAFKVSTTDVAGLIKTIEAKYKAMAPGRPFSYQFLDESFDQMYRTEQRAGKVALSFAILAILIACLGLFGLATYMAEQRTKEIGVRKVLGASVSTIVNMLSKDFLKLVGISILFAFPLAGLLMHWWLQDFAYRTNLGWWIFVVAAAITGLIAIVTVSAQAFKAALTNPVKSLRSE
ncbi:MAG: ABC transporter permease [Bacteroidota bacterium]